MLDNAVRDQLSSEFCVLLTKHLPNEDGNKNSVWSKSSERIDSSPSEMLLFVAEVAQVVYEVVPLPHCTFPKTVVRQTAYSIKLELFRGNFNYDTEERLMLYWASILRVMSAFRVSRSTYALSEADIEAMGATFEELKAHTLRYNLCSYERVKEYINGKSSMPI